MSKIDLVPYAKELRRIGFERDGMSRDRDGLQYKRSFGRRLLTVQLWRSGLFRVSHMLDERESTHPTRFYDITSMHAAIRLELYREDHPPAQMPRPQRRKAAVLRPAVAYFAEQMELTLRRHDRRKGKNGWRGVPYAVLFDLLRREVAELETVRTRSGLANSRRQARLGAEAVDVANLCMMIFDVGYVPR